MQKERAGKADRADAGSMPEGMARHEKRADAGDASMQERILSFLYDTVPGRFLLRPLVSPWFSRLGGRLLDTRLSALAVGPFVRANHIDLSECVTRHFSSYNDFFTRRLVDSARPADRSPDAVVSPCDARLSVYPVTDDGCFTVKRTAYTLPQLLHSRELAKRYRGGFLWLYRLCVDDYHRYIFPDDGFVSSCRHISGVFHTVNPIANDHYPIYKENTREYCLLRTAHCGTMLIMEVGAMLVGKIENRPLRELAEAEAGRESESTGKHLREGVREHDGLGGAGGEVFDSLLPGVRVHRGQEKGNFAFGGSTIIVLTQPGCAAPERIYLENTGKGVETKVRMGQRVGTC